LLGVAIVFFVCCIRSGLNVAVVFFGCCIRFRLMLQQQRESGKLGPSFGGELVAGEGARGLTRSREGADPIRARARARGFDPLLPCAWR